METLMYSYQRILAPSILGYNHVKMPSKASDVVRGLVKLQEPLIDEVGKLTLIYPYQNQLMQSK
jgi:hypothetical protein